MPILRSLAEALRIATCAIFFLGGGTANADSALTGSVQVHDPSRIVKEGNRYYAFATGTNIATKYSDDLVRWVNGPRVFSSPPAWTTAAVPGFTNNFWAPDIQKVGDQYRLYYSVSTFGSQVSAIGLATNSTLDSASPAYQWVDRGAVIQSQVGSSYNAIDPSVFHDTTGKAWLTFGSFWQGIYVTELDPMTGLRIAPTAPVTRVAQNSPSTEIEAASLVKHGDFYYLFVDWGKCCSGVNSTYNIRVGRSSSPTGPFTDKGRNNMVNSGGTLLLGTEGNLIGPGHFGLFEENGVEYMSYHYYDGANNGTSKLDIRKLAWTPAGWPVLADTLPAPDFNHDGTVGATDLPAWSERFGVDGGADADADGYSNGHDFLEWQRQLAAPAASPQLQSVPEPTIEPFVLSTAVLRAAAAAKLRRGRRSETP